MCPHTAPISRAGKAAASAAGRLLRAFEAELAPVVEAISPAAMVRSCVFFFYLSRTRLMPLFSRAPRREELALIPLARCLLREIRSFSIASAGERAEKGASLCATSDGEQEFFFQLFSSKDARPRSRRGRRCCHPFFLDSVSVSSGPLSLFLSLSLESTMNVKTGLTLTA